VRWYISVGKSISKKAMEKPITFCTCYSSTLNQETGTYYVHLNYKRQQICQVQVGNPSTHVLFRINSSPGFKKGVILVLDELLEDHSGTYLQTMTYELSAKDRHSCLFRTGTLLWNLHAKQWERKENAPGIYMCNWKTEEQITIISAEKFYETVTLALSKRLHNGKANR